MPTPLNALDSDSASAACRLVKTSNNTPDRGGCGARGGRLFLLIAWLAQHAVGWRWRCR